jgi:hypothetical protein
MQNTLNQKDKSLPRSCSDGPLSRMKYARFFFATVFCLILSAGAGAATASSTAVIDQVSAGTHGTLTEISLVAEIPCFAKNSRLDVSEIETGHFQLRVDYDYEQYDPSGGPVFRCRSFIETTFEAKLSSATPPVLSFTNARPRMDVQFD